MNIGYGILIIICLIALYVLILDLKIVSYNPYTLLKVVCWILFSFSALRYLTLIVYGSSTNYNQMMALRRFYLASSIGLTIPTASAVWYVTPLYRERIKYPYYLMALIPWILFYIYIIVKQPTQIVSGESFGYRLELIGQFPNYLGKFQGAFVGGIITLSMIGIIKYRNLQIRAQLIIIIMAQLILALDGLTINWEGIRSIPPFTLSEVFGFGAIYYAFRFPVKEIRGISSRS